MIKTWQQRCEEHPDHQQGIVTQQMIQDRMQEEIDELRQALAQPPCQTGSQCIGGKCPECEREWVGLTDEEIHEMIMGMRSRNMGVVMTEEIFREVEAKLKEKNGG